jgi:hypothetical protein
VIIDHSTPGGFENIAEARQNLLRMGRKEFDDPEMLEEEIQGSHVVAPVSFSHFPTKNIYKQSYSVRTMLAAPSTNLEPRIENLFVAFHSVCSAQPSSGTQNTLA